ncbi:MAG: acyl-CoA dehydratase activase [Syntrophomonadaceae bacterium]|nr:acyl-CoA dehydratase activase [Syntrophomonadaceae bacterium]MDD3024293.1 acyl-CoA dehydratase activase [Syntrophomonadaceae bacterium]
MIGIDLGSRSVKIVQMYNGNIIQRAIFDTIEFYRKFACMGKSALYPAGTTDARLSSQLMMHPAGTTDARLSSQLMMHPAGTTDARLSSQLMMHLDFEKLGFEKDCLIATGYGKIAVQVEGAKQIPEIQAHVAGAIFQSSRSDFTLLDIGGQDTKVVQVRDAHAVDFLTNDRCAASSGRYMENMATVLGMSLEELSSWEQEPVELNSTCAIFGETEIIARIVEGHPLSHLAAGINYALYRRVATMLKKLKSDIILLSGGGALNSALRNIIARETRCEVYSLPEPQLNGAIGCCMYEHKED